MPAEQDKPNTTAQALAKRGITSVAIPPNKTVMVTTPGGQFIKRDTHFSLSVREDTLVKILPAKKAYGDMPAQPATFIPTAKAWTAIASKSAVVLNPHPDHIVVGDGPDGKPKMVGSGWKDKDGVIYCAAEAGGLTELGQPAIVRRVVSYDVHRYNIQDLLAKAKQDKFKQYFQVLPFEGKSDRGAMLGGQKGWAGYQIDETVVLWVDCKCPEYIRWLGEMNNRIKTADRVAQTFAARNAIAAHPACPVSTKFHNDSAVVKCVSWMPVRGQIDFKQLKAAGVEIDVSVESITPETVAPADMAATTAGTEAAPEDAAPAAETFEAESEAQPEGSEADAPADEQPAEEEPTGSAVIGTLTGSKKPGRDKGSFIYSFFIEGTRYGTFDTPLGEQGMGLIGKTVKLTWAPSGKYKNAQTIELATGKPEAPAHAKEPEAPTAAPDQPQEPTVDQRIDELVSSIQKIRVYWKKPYVKHCVALDIDSDLQHDLTTEPGPKLARLLELLQAEAKNVGR